MTTTVFGDVTRTPCIFGVFKVLDNPMHFLLQDLNNLVWHPPSPLRSTFFRISHALESQSRSEEERDDEEQSVQGCQHLVSSDIFCRLALLLWYHQGAFPVQIALFFFHLLALIIVTSFLLLLHLHLDDGATAANFTKLKRNEKKKN